MVVEAGLKISLDWPKTKLVEFHIFRALANLVDLNLKLIAIWCKSQIDISQNGCVLGFDRNMYTMYVRLSKFHMDINFFI